MLICCEQTEFFLLKYEFTAENNIFLLQIVVLQLWESIGATSLSDILSSKRWTSFQRQSLLIKLCNKYDYLSSNVALKKIEIR